MAPAVRLLVGSIALCLLLAAGLPRAEARELLSASPEKTEPHARIGWYVDRTADAQRDAAARGLPLVLVLSPARCEDCRDFERNVLACAAINRFAGEAVFVLANPSRDPAARALGAAQKVLGYPATLMFDPDAPSLDALVRLEGYLPAGNLSLFLLDALPSHGRGLPRLEALSAAWARSARLDSGAPQDCAVDPDSLLPGLSPDTYAAADEFADLDDGAVEAAGPECRSQVDEYDDIALDCSPLWPKWGGEAALGLPPAADPAAPALRQDEVLARAAAASFAVFGFEDDAAFAGARGRFLGPAVAVGPRALIATCHGFAGHGLLAVNGPVGAGRAEARRWAEVKIVQADAASDRCRLGLEDSEAALEPGAVLAGGIRTAASMPAREPMVALSLLQGSEVVSYQIQVEPFGGSGGFTVPDADMVLDLSAGGALIFDRRGALVGLIPMYVAGELRPGLALPAERFWQD
jgi:hypothetical protein